MTEKEQNKNPTASPKEEKPETPLTEEQRQKRRKMLVYPLMGLLFAGSMWLIFAPSDKDKAEAQQGVGFNTEMPLPVEAGIIADKRTAYEQAKMEEKQKERRAQMNDLAALFSDKDDKAETQSEEFDLLDPEPQQPARNYGGGSRPQRTIRSSAVAYEDINRTLGNFYETPAEDPEKEEMRERIEELEAMMARQAEPSGSTLDDQVALLEKSYELAAKYMPSGQGGTSQQPSAADTKEDKKTVRNGKAVAQPVGQVAERIVSTLAQPMTDSEFITAQTDERNLGFQTAVGTSSAVGRNTIPACVHGNQTVTDGQAVRLRLTEPMQVGGVRIPRNTVVVGTGARRTARRRHHLVGVSGDDHPRRAGRFRQRRTGGYLHSQLDGGKCGQRGGGQHGGVARQQHQHLHRRGSAARLRPRQRVDSRHEPIHCQEDAHGQSAFEGRI